MNSFKLVKDLTKDTRQIARQVNEFPKVIKIKKVYLVVDDLETYFIDADYEIGNITFNTLKRVYGCLSGAIIELLSHMKNIYRIYYDSKVTYTYGRPDN